MIHGEAMGTHPSVAGSSHLMTPTRGGTEPEGIGWDRLALIASEFV